MYGVSCRECNGRSSPDKNEGDVKPCVLWELTEVSAALSSAASDQSVSRSTYSSSAR
jgi:hypothetical protein